MQHITVDVQDHDKAQLLYNVLQSLDFVVQISLEDSEIDHDLQQETGDRTDEFFSYAGLWRDRDISVTTLRQQAWPRQAG